MNEKTRIQIGEMKKQTIGVEVEMYNISEGSVYDGRGILVF